MTTPKTAFSTCRCEIRTDDLTRQLYATDASLYQLIPAAVAFPRSAADAAEAIRCAVDAGVAVTPRGAGTGLAGGALGEGLIVDFSPHLRQITALDRDRMTVRVGAGVVLDQLNDFLRPSGLCFGPDVATSSRATLGGMISNNSSGARAPIYGTTADHVRSVEAVLADGTILTLSADADSLAQTYRDRVAPVVQRVEAEIRRRMPDELVKRWPGYALDDYLRCPGDLTKLVAGSEGTLVAVTSAELCLVPLPREKGLGLIFFASVDEAMQATAALLDLYPAAIEHVDRVLFDQTRNQRVFQPVRQLLNLDDEAVEAFLMVEFYDGARDKLETLRQRNLGLRTHICRDNGEMAMVWNLRKAGLSLLTGRKGPVKPVPGLEDVAVRPERLPGLVREFEALLEPLGILCSFYGHAASGLLHVRPVVDLHRAEDIAQYRELAVALSSLAARYRGSLAGEHGVGMARAEFMDEHLGPDLIAAMQEIKAIFDPSGRMNPGKVFPGAYRIDDNLRWGAGYAIRLPFEPVLAFAAKDESFVGNLEQCNGCGGCRKDTPTMCPTFRATGEEIMSTRGRANTIRAVLDGRLDGGLASPALEEALSNCLSCKACTSECPSNVNLSLLKAELMHARQKEQGPTLGERVFSRPDLLGRLGTVFPRLANASLRAPWLRRMLERAIGLDARRTVPPYTLERFDRWFRRSRPAAADGARERVILWDDCFVRYNEPEIGRAAVAVLEAAGFEVVLPDGHGCCGRPAFSNGRLNEARRMGARNLALLADTDLPVIFLEPSCYSMFTEDYRELKLAHAEEVAQRCFLLEQFVAALVKSDAHADLFRETAQRVVVHAHCHTRAVADPNVQVEVVRAIPGTEARLLDSGCCGMAGAFGMRHEKYELSLKVAEPLVEAVKGLPSGTRVIASGTSCRHQIADLTGVRPVHLAQVLAEALTAGTRKHG